MTEAIKIKKGADIRLVGEAEKVLVDAPSPEVVAIKPTDFHGVTPKLVAKPGEEVKAGSVLFYDKYNEKVKFTSPVSGEVTEVVRGEKRKILEIRILSDKGAYTYEDFGAADPSSLSADEIKDKICASGLWGAFVQRPFAVIANPSDTPKSIHISCFDTNPLAADIDFILNGQTDMFQAGVDALLKLTSGNVFCNLSAETGFSKPFENIKGAKISKFKGPHPAGNVGVQIHHIDPINKGEIVWTIDPVSVVMIGKLFKTGKADFSKVIALAGSEVTAPKYYKTIVGANVRKIVDGNIKGDNVRIISGNVLTGEKVEETGFLGFYHNQITVIPEGDNPKFFLTEGWLSPGLDKFSLSKAFPTWLMPSSKKFVLDTNMNGEERPFVVTGELEKVFPFDIYPMQLIKSIMVNDIELMENLGIYEVAPEDFSLCEYVCTSKIDIQDVVRKGLDNLKNELS
jgi:Na+-transporting NADH:ubiquinone oxidoreductase subunit A